MLVADLHDDPGVALGAAGALAVDPRLAHETASAPAITQSEGAYVLIRFQPDANVTAITNFLETNRLSIASGPSEGGLYRVRVADKNVPRSDLDRIIKTLQIDPVVGLIVTTK